MTSDHNTGISLVRQTRPQSEPTAEIAPVDLGRPRDGAELLALLDHYARDPMGGGHGLSTYARDHLLAALTAQANYRGWIARENGEAVALVNCFLGLSTFAARPLMNIHDIVVRSDRRGRGLAQALLAEVERAALAAGCCKMTLEVLSGNRAAQTAYLRFGFRPYALDPDAGTAQFMEKKLSV